MSYELLEESGNFEVKDKITEVGKEDKLTQKEKQEKFETELNHHITESVKSIYTEYEGIKNKNLPEWYKKQTEVGFDDNGDVKQLGTNMKLISSELDSVLKNNPEYAELRQKVDNIILLVDQLDQLDQNKNTLEGRIKNEISHELWLFKKKFDETKWNDTFDKTKEFALDRKQNKEDIETFKNNIIIDSTKKDLTVWSVTKNGDWYDVTFDLKLSDNTVSKTTLYFGKDGKFKGNATDQAYVSEWVYDIWSYKLLVKKWIDNKISVDRSKSVEELKKEATDKIDLWTYWLSISWASYEPKPSWGTDIQGYDQVRIEFKDSQSNSSSFVVDSNSWKLVSPRDTIPNMIIWDITYTITQDQDGKIKIEKQVVNTSDDVPSQIQENPNKAIIDKLNSVSSSLQLDSDYIWIWKRNQVDENVGIVQSSLLAINKISWYEGILKTSDNIIEGNFVDKKFGQLTYGSVQAFQEKYKDTLPDTEKGSFEVDGLPWKQTIDAMVKVLENTSTIKVDKKLQSEKSRLEENIWSYLKELSTLLPWKNFTFKDNILTMNWTAYTDLESNFDRNINVIDGKYFNFIRNEKWNIEELFIGEWKDGKRNGQGIAIFNNNKSIYEGGFKNGKFDWNGTYINPSGKKFEWSWKNHHYIDGSGNEKTIDQLNQYTSMFDNGKLKPFLENGNDFDMVNFLKTAQWQSLLKTDNFTRSDNTTINFKIPNSGKIYNISGNGKFQEWNRQWFVYTSYDNNKPSIYFTYWEWDLITKVYLDWVSLKIEDSQPT